MGGNYHGAVNSRFIGPEFTVPSADQNPRLRFWQWYNISSSDNATVQIKVADGAWTTISETYTHTGGGIWTYPSIDLSDYADLTVQIAFYFVSDNNGYSVSSGWYIDDLEVITGPIVYNNPEGWELGLGDWYPDKGTWEVGTPTSGPGSAYSGEHCVATVLGGNYHGAVNSRFIGPEFTVPSADQNPNLRFWHWYSIASGDAAILQIRTENSQWQTILGPYTSTSGGIWSPIYFDLSSYADSTIQLAFNLTSDDNGYSVSSGWYIDDLKIGDNSNLDVDAGPDVTINTGSSATLNATVTGGTQPYTYEWVPAEGLDEPGKLNPVATPADTTTYTLKVTDSNNCFRTDKMTVFVNVIANVKTDILSYGFPEQTGPATIDIDSHTVGIEVEYGTDVTSLVASFTLSDGASAKVGGVAQESGITFNDFTNPVTYTVTAEDGVTFQDWVVTVSVAPNDETDILSYGFAEQTGPATIDTDSHTVGIEVEYGTDVTSLVASFTLSDGASAKVGGVAQESGITSNDFTNPVTYTVTAEDGVTFQDWVVTVSVAPNDETDILSYGFAEQTGPATIDTDSHTVGIEVEYGTDVTSLVASFTLSDGASAKVGGVAQESGITSNDFTNPVTYTVTAEDGVTFQDWVVTVSVAPNDETDILSYSFGIPPQTGDAIIDADSHTVGIEVEYGTDVTSLVASFTLSDGASAKVGGVAQESGITSNDFTNPVTYIVTAEDGVTAQDWVVTVNLATGIGEHFIQDLKIYPNPFSDQTTIEFSNPNHSKYKLAVYSISGRKVFEMDGITTEKVAFEKDNLSAGIYILELTGEQIFRERIIIE